MNRNCSGVAGSTQRSVEILANYRHWSSFNRIVAPSVAPSSSAAHLGRRLSRRWVRRRRLQRRGELL